MAFIPCKIGGGGSGGFTTTTLWTNNSSSSNFAAQEITLSDDIDNYDYIGVDYKYNTGSSDVGCHRMLMSSSDIKNATYNTSVARCGLEINIISSSNISFARQIYYINDTKLRFATTTQVGSSTTSNALAIPVRVVGCKFA